MYLNSAKIATSRVLNGLMIGIVSFLTFINLLFVIFSFSDEAVKRGFVALIFCGFFSVLVIGGIAVIVWRINVIRRFTKARIYNSIIEEDHDGIIDYDTFASMNGTDVDKAVSEIVWLYRHRYLINITLGRTAVRVDLLSDEKEFVKVSCPSCGAQITIRKNGGGRCDHCGTFMRAKGDANV